MNEAYEGKMKAPDPFNGVNPDRIPKRENLHKWPGSFIVMPDIYNMTSVQIANITREEISKDIYFLAGNTYCYPHLISQILPVRKSLKTQILCRSNI